MIKLHMDPLDAECSYRDDAEVKKRANRSRKRKRVFTEAENELKRNSGMSYEAKHPIVSAKTIKNT